MVFVTIKKNEYKTKYAEGIYCLLVGELCEDPHQPCYKCKYCEYYWIEHVGVSEIKATL